MIITTVRAYLKKQISLACPNLIENNSAFYDSDIGERIIDRSYQIEINNITTNTRNSQYIRTFPCVISIFGFGYRDPIANYDEIMDKAICISDNVISLKSFNEEDFIIDAIESNITSTQLAGDDNGFKVDINLNITLAYSKE